MADFVLERDVSLAAHTTLQLGGPARFWVNAQDEDTLLAALRWAREEGHRAVVLGGGSNLVVADVGFDGLVIKIATTGICWEPSDGASVCVTAQAGESWDDLVNAAVARELSGIECLSGIPGLVGATPIQNVGAYGQSVSDTIEHVRVLDRRTLQRVTWTAEDCRFSYRHSRFKDEPDRFVVLAVCFRLALREEPKLLYPELRKAMTSQDPTVASVREVVLQLRRAKSMVIEENDPNRRSAGSFFTNPIVPIAQAEAVAELAMRNGWAGADGKIPQFPQGDGRVKLAAAWLIERAGFKKGSREGAVGQSSKHALALVHHGGGTTRELLAYARSIQGAVKDTFGIELQQEPSRWGE